MIQAKVVRRFRDKHTRKRYKVGDVYSHKDANRIEELQELNILERSKEPETQWPKHTGGGNYELSNGEKIKGKEDALKAQAEIDKQPPGE